MVTSLLLLACARPPDLVLVTIDTTRRDAVGAYGGPATPGMDGLAAEGVRYAEARSVVPLTVPAHAAILTGRWPTSTGVRDNSDARLPDAETTLAEALAGAGYDTGASVGAALLARGTGFEQGFGWIDGPAAGAGVERRADAVVDAALGWLGQDHGDRPIFLWVHLYDPHAPYDAPAASPPRPGTRDAYDGEVAFADAQIARLLGALRARPRWGETGVVLLSDHGEGLGDHGEREHGALVFASTTAVPLITRAPLGSAGPSPAVVTTPVSVVDVLPTMLGWAGVALPAGVDGQRLDAPARPVYVESHYLAAHLGWAPLDAEVDGDGMLLRSTRLRRYGPHDEPRDAPTEPPGAAFLAHFGVPDTAPAGTPTSAGAAATDARLAALGYLDAANPTRHAAIDPVDGVAGFEALRDAGEALARGDLQAATAAIAIARDVDPEGPTTRLLEVGLRGRTDPAGAIPEARAIVADWPSPQARATLGETLARAGQLAEAAPYLLEAAKGQTPPPAQMGLLGLALDATDDPAAEDWLVRALSAGAEEPLLRGALGRARLHANAPDEALPWLEEEIARYPPAIEARKSYVEALLALQRWPQALLAIDGLEAVRPPDAGSEFGRALALHHTGDDAGAGLALKACLARPRPPEVCVRAARGRW